MKKFIIIAALLAICLAAPADQKTATAQKDSPKKDSSDNKSPILTQEQPQRQARDVVEKKPQGSSPKPQTLPEPAEGQSGRKSRGLENQPKAPGNPSPPGNPTPQTLPAPALDQPGRKIRDVENKTLPEPVKAPSSRKTRGVEKQENSPKPKTLPEPAEGQPARKTRGAEVQPKTQGNPPKPQTLPEQVNNKPQDRQARDTETNRPQSPQSVAYSHRPLANQQGLKNGANINNTAETEKTKRETDSSEESSEEHKDGNKPDQVTQLSIPLNPEATTEVKKQKRDTSSQDISESSQESDEDVKKPKPVPVSDVLQNNRPKRGNDQVPTPESSTKEQPKPKRGAQDSHVCGEKCDLKEHQNKNQQKPE